jgi:FkbM family methyltransferase
VVISYAQNAEDAVLARLFDQQPTGFYVDIGAGHPVLDSVTKHFYDRQWRGMNIEPMRRMFDLLLQERPRDINVHAAVSNVEGTVTLYEAPESDLGSSTINEAIAASRIAAGDSFTPVDVDVVTLGSLVERHGVNHIDFLKIDVEGHEAEIIHSTDWSALRPRVLVIEAVKPGSTDPSHEDWEHVLTAANYVCTLFDGVNRFYAQAEDEPARKVLSTPANVFDDVEPWRWVSQIEGAKKHILAVEEARMIAERYAEDLRDHSALTRFRRRVMRGVRSTFAR